MKKTIVVIFVLCRMAAALPCQAQINEFSLAYGIKSTNGQKITASVLDDFVTIFTLGLITYDTRNIQETGPVVATWKRFGNSRLGYGASVGYMKASFDAVSGSLWFDSQNTKHAEYSALTVAPEIDFVYLKRARLGIYSSLGIGYTLVSVPTEHSDENINYPSDHFDFYFSPLGITYGEEIAAFAELGIGYKGLFQFGFSFRFGENQEKNASK